ncbi:hypothetical protein [Chitinasiproducens palmae]|uniref:Uncharacterized protein n=1 Tax=Chitinasiproducens palmae TaxID=1770053 RepID=A0A1H2PQI8_9BURK|nr:hypothetical protein [Chitinasiproducens palmae]SDV49084.1 hypothetical protein SAMN05216551_10753 [Chitinasiproducens palmae]
MTLEDRLENWGRVVRSPLFKFGVCAKWAAWYCGIRGFVRDADDEFLASQPPITRDDRDGWDVERAWKTMTNPVTKELLKQVYVERRSMEQIRTIMWKMHNARIRTRAFPFALQNAHRDIERELTRMERERLNQKNSCKPAETVL